MARTWLAALALLASAGPAAARQPKVGDMAPNFTLKLVDGSSVTLEQLRGQVVVLNFWATWCGPCRAELPLLDSYYKLQQRHGLKVYAVTTEDSLPLFKMKPLFAAMTIQPVKSVRGPYAELSAVPTNYVIDRAGRVRYLKAGAFDLDTLNTVLVPLLKEPTPAATAAN